MMTLLAVAVGAAAEPGHPAMSPASTRRCRAAFEDRMGGDQTAVLEDADHRRRALCTSTMRAGAIGNAVVVAADRDQPVMADAPFELEERIERA